MRTSPRNLASWVHHRGHRAHRGRKEERGSDQTGVIRAQPFLGSVNSVLSVVEKHSVASDADRDAVTRFSYPSSGERVADSGDAAAGAAAPRSSSRVSATARARFALSTILSSLRSFLLGGRMWSSI